MMRLPVVWGTREDGTAAAFTAEGVEVDWAATPGGQHGFLHCPIYEVLLEGPRGGGKTDALIMDFARHVGEGYGAEWQGILFRQTYKQLSDVIKKTKKWFPILFPSASFNETKYFWRFAGGEELHLSYIEREEDYWNYHGHAYPWIGFEELTTWPDDKCYRSMMSCCRSTIIGMPRKIRATTNPYGAGHNWVKARFRLPSAEGRIHGDVIQIPGEPLRMSYHSKLTENLPLLSADPDYITRIRAAARNPAELAAWIDGDWTVIAGGMFDDLWSPGHNIVPDLRASEIPPTWRINRSYDYGQSAPFSVGWWAQSNGEPITVEGRLLGTVRGDVIRIAEWYGWNGTPNEGLRMTSVEIADGILDREKRWGLEGRVKPGPADSSIYSKNEGTSYASSMAKRGVRFTPADKGPGSRVQGWELMRKLMRGAVPSAEGVREDPGLFICRGCDQFIRTVPVLPRSTKNPDDVDTATEDHIADEARYRLREEVKAVAMRNI